ncbi:alpha/beta hydrolase [Neobacillus cucumis]|uniref:Esterase n=1 Tax=Neobacillus cucumis TaxID=1740721 RepID=A0A2N5HC75_9BACI|nr:alpha/beta hydrolase-fold protein [Neobacillus cucumis]PLS03113.1 esterase [Neobacillus cucumis]
MIENFPLFMSSFNQERTIRVYLPESYSNQTKDYPVLYMQDGQNVFEDDHAIKGVSLGLKDYLNRSGLEIIVVAIDLNPEGEERVNEYCPWVNGKISEEILGFASPTGGRGEEYLNFIVTELKPTIDKKYWTRKDHTSIAGISLGGLISTYAACRYPKIFKRVAAISPGYYRNQEEIENLLKISDLTSIEKFYLDFGTTEVGADEKMNKFLLNLTNRVVDILHTKTPNLHFELIEKAEHAYPFFQKRVTGMLSYLYSDL